MKNLLIGLKRVVISASVLFVLSSLFISNAIAGTGWVIDAKVARILSGDNYNGCMILVDKVIANESPELSSCVSSWVSLDCDAVYHTQAQANAMWSSALVAFSLQKNINLQINSDRKVGAYCIARRIDVLN